MDAHAIAIFAGIIAGYFIFEVKAEDFIGLPRFSGSVANNRMIGERQEPAGIMVQKYDEYGVSGDVWYSEMLTEEGRIVSFDNLLQDLQVLGYANRMADPINSLALFNLRTNWPADNKADWYSMIFETPAVHHFPEFIERGSGWERRNEKFPMGGPWERANRPWEIIPEPMAVSLFVLSGIGLLFARRMFRKT